MTRSKKRSGIKVRKTSYKKNYYKRNGKHTCKHTCKQTYKRIQKKRARRSQKIKMIGGVMTRQEYSSGANDFQRKILNVLFPDLNIWTSAELIQPKMIIFERRKDNGNFNIIYDEHMLLSNYCKRFYKGSGEFAMLRDYTNELYDIKPPINLKFHEAMELLCNSYPENLQFEKAWTDKIQNEPDDKEKFKMAICDALHQICRMANAISIFYDGYNEGSILSRNKNICTINMYGEINQDPVYSAFIKSHLPNAENIAAGYLINSIEVKRLVVCRINVLLLFIMMDTYKNRQTVFPSVYTENLRNAVITGINVINQTFINAVARLRSSNTMDVEVFKKYTNDLNAFCIQKANEIDGKAEEEYKTKNALYVKTNRDILPSSSASPSPIKPFTTSLQTIYSMLILFQGMYFFNDYFGKIFVPEMADSNYLFITRGIDLTPNSTDVPFIVKNSKKINSLFDLGPLSRCAPTAMSTASKPMIENYLFNNKSCIVKVNEKGETIIETTYAYLVTFQANDPILISIILSKDEANLSTNSYKQMDQVRNVLTEENKTALISFVNSNPSEVNPKILEFLSELETLDKYVRQPSHTYNGKYCVFLDKADRDRLGNQGTPKEKECYSATNVATTASRAATDRLKYMGRKIGVGKELPDTVERGESPFIGPIQGGLGTSEDLTGNVDLDAIPMRGDGSIKWRDSDQSILEMDPRPTNEDEKELETEEYKKYIGQPEPGDIFNPGKTLQLPEMQPPRIIPEETLGPQPM